MFTQQFALVSSQPKANDEKMRQATLVVCRFFIAGERWGVFWL